MKLLLLLGLISAPSVFPQSYHINIHGDVNTGKTTEALFGRLRGYGSVNTLVCTDSLQAFTFPRAQLQIEISRQAKIAVLPTNVAMTVIAAAQGSSKLQLGLKAAAVSIGFLSALSSGGAISLSRGIAQGLNGAAYLGELAIPAVAAVSTTHQLVDFSTNTIADILQFQPLGCSTGIVLFDQPKHKKVKPSPTQAIDPKSFDATISVSIGGTNTK